MTLPTWKGAPADVNGCDVLPVQVSRQVISASRDQLTSVMR
jgi:hypothetical protein